jgi:hypothetical protein
MQKLMLVKLDKKQSVDTQLYRFQLFLFWVSVGYVLLPWLRGSVESQEQRITDSNPAMAESFEGL